MEKNILYNKGGGKTGGISARLSLPMNFLKDMNITENENVVELIYNEKKKEIIIKKKN